MNKVFFSLDKSSEILSKISKEAVMLTFQEIVESIESLPIEDQDQLLELIRTRRIEQKRAEILANAQEVMQSFRDGTAKRGNVNDLIADLLGDDNGSCLE